MSTHAIPRGTCNFPVNMPREMRREVGRLATIEGAPSVGAWVRDVLRDRLAAAHAHGVEVVRDARQMLLPLGCVLMIGLGLGCVMVASVAGDNEPRNGRRVRGRRRDEMVMVDTMEGEG